MVITDMVTLCHQSLCHILQWWVSDIDHVGYLFCLMSYSTKEGICGGQLHS